ncbi:hypothetical protein C8J57DRAFT_1529228 [Mycena rebaudengoi]|nr:hypothetical protein C8J57DRAFT_1529228 [Mycena rebaudengoi]
MPRHTAPYRALISSTAQPIAPHRAPMRPQAPGIRRDPARPHPPHPNVTPRARHPNPNPCHPPPAAPPSSRRTSRLPPPASRRLLPARQRTRHPRIFAHHAAARLLVRPPPPVRPSSCNIRTPSSRPGFVCVYCPMLSLQRPPSQIRLLVAAHWPPLVRQPVRNIGIHYTHPALPQWPTPLPSLSIQTLPLRTISRRTALATTTPSPTTSTSTSSSVSHPCDGSAYAPSDASFVEIKLLKRGSCTCAQYTRSISYSLRICFDSDRLGPSEFASSQLHFILVMPKSPFGSWQVRWGSKTGTEDTGLISFRASCTEAHVSGGDVDGSAILAGNGNKRGRNGQRNTRVPGPERGKRLRPGACLSHPGP